MRRREFLAGAATIAGVAQAHALGIGKLGVGFGHGGLLGGPQVVAPIVLPITANLAGFYSVVQLSTWSGNCLRVRRSSDNTEQDIGFKRGTVDKAAADTFAAGSNLFITKWYDQSGNTRDLAQATQANQPSFGQPGEWRGIRGISIDGISGSTTVQKWLQGAATGDRSTLTAYQFLTPSTHGNVVQYEFTAADFLTRYAQIYTNQAPLGVNYGSAIATGIMGRTNPGVVAISTGPGGIIARHHGVEATNVTAPASQALGGLVLGKSLAGSTFNGAHNTWAFAYYTATHSSANMQAIEASINASFQPATSFTKRLLYGGSSLITGAFSTLNQNPPYWAGFTYSPDWETFSCAAFGRTLTAEFGTRGDYDTLGAAFASFSKMVAVIDAPSNDINGATYADQATAISAGTALYSTTPAVPFINNLKTNHFTVVVPTVIARTGWVSGSGNFKEDARLAYNAAVIAGASGNGHLVSDRAGDSRLQNTADTTYFAADGIHLTNLGYSALASIDKAAILSA